MGEVIGTADIEISVLTVDQDVSAAFMKNRLADF